MISEYEADVVLSQTLSRDDTRNSQQKDEAKVKRAAELLSRLKPSKARKFLESNGIGDHNSEDIIAQMTKKHPKRKKPITPLTAAELAHSRKGTDRKVFESTLTGLTHYTAPGLGCLRNEHLTALRLNPDRQMSPSAAALIDNYHEYANAVVQVVFPPYFYTAWVASSPRRGLGSHS